MSQQLIPVDGGVVPQVQTTLATSTLKVLSTQYIEVNKLENRPTEWVPGGRPIYRRLPATSETYQIDFFNVVNESNILGNTFVTEGIEEVGYVYTPYGESINGPLSLEVSASDSNRDLLIQAGTIVWKYGKNQVLPTIANLRVLDVGSGSYELAYQLIYDDTPIPKLYEVNDFSLAGLPLTLTSSTDSVVGWRKNPVNAFINTSTLVWSNEDTYFPSYAQPDSAYLQWKTELAQAYRRLILRCPAGTAYEGTATLSYVNNSILSPVAEVDVSRDSQGQFFEFLIDRPELQTGWNVSFSGLTVSIESISVSGQITLKEPQAALSPRARLVLYPANTLPPTTTTLDGREILATYCRLAIVDVGPAYNVLRIDDQRTIIHRDYVPVANWLTTPFDLDLINLYEQVSEYVPLWMAPTSAMRQEYTTLTKDQIVVEG